VHREKAVELIQGLVTIPSISRQETQAAAWLVEQMGTQGYARAYVDEAGNAVGEIGMENANKTVILLGHIDTVPGDIPVRIEASEEGEILYGRGSVDAKGPLATFTAAVAKLGHEWAVEQDIRLVVVGAVEEEAATSKGARFIRDRFNGELESIPQACIIGEPSSWSKVTLGYKGRILIEMDASQPMAHTAGPDPGVATIAVDFWNWLWDYANTFNAERSKMFDQLLPSLRSLHTSTDAQMHDHVEAKVGIRLPLNFDIHTFTNEIIQWASQRIQADLPVTNHQLPTTSHQPPATNYHLLGTNTDVKFHFHAHESAWRSDRNNVLVRSFLAAIRKTVLGTRPGFRVKSGTSDMNVVAPTWQCPILAYGPGDAALDHTPNEHIHLDEYWQAILVLEEALRTLSESL